MPPSPPRRVATNASATAAGASSTLVMESSPESAITQDFNPFVPTVAPQGMGATGLIYEPLLQFDLAAPPKYYNWLATSYKWADDGKSISFTPPDTKPRSGAQLRVRLALSASK